MQYNEDGTLQLTQSALHHLRWMLQKDILKQDMFLIGQPGSLRRQLAMQYLELTQRELEYIALSRDTTESDLKQRREIKDKAAIYYDQVSLQVHCVNINIFHLIYFRYAVCCACCHEWPCLGA